MTKFEHDVFISYAHIDNEPFGAERGWVSAFADDLAKVLRRGLGCNTPSIWMDHALTGNQPFTQKIEDALRSSATLLVVASPAYLKSDWCTRERNAFLSTVREKSASRIFRIDLDRLNRDDFPAEFGELLGYTFWGPDCNGNPRTFGMPVNDAQREPEYITALTKLRMELGAELTRIHSMESATEVVAPPVATIFLAEVTDDLDAQREALSTYAKQANLRVLPETLYPYNDVAEYRRRMAADLKESKVFVQLLSELPGKKPQGWDARLPALQYEEAKKTGLAILQWRGRELDTARMDIADMPHRVLLVGPDVRACGSGEFKRAVVEEATRPPKLVTGKAPSSNILVFVNSDSPDRDIADDVCRILKSEGVGYSMPIYDEQTKPADVRADLELNLSMCDGLIVVYGHTPVTWVRRQLAQGHKILSQRDQPLTVLGLVEGPPPSKQDVGFQLPNMLSLDCKDGVRREVLSRFVASLRD
ncbi:TIR domain-containing protein [Paraburkholderia terrae]